MVVYKDIALNLRVINEALIKDYADKEELESIMPHLLGTGKDVLKGLYEITFLMQERGPIERWKIISLDLEIGRYISRITETHLIDNEADEKEDAFISMLRGIYAMCTRYAEMLMELDGMAMLGGTIVNYKKEQPTKEMEKIEWPHELSNGTFKEIVRKGIEAGLIEEHFNGLIWKGTKELLAYFAERVSNLLELSTKIDAKGNQTISWKPFERLFNVDKLKEAKQNKMRLYPQFKPNKHEEIDQLLKEMPTHP